LDDGQKISFDLTIMRSKGARNAGYVNIRDVQHMINDDDHFIEISPENTINASNISSGEAELMPTEIIPTRNTVNRGCIVVGGHRRHVPSW